MPPSYWNMSHSVSVVCYSWFLLNSSVEGKSYVLINLYTPDSSIKAGLNNLFRGLCYENQIIQIGKYVIVYQLILQFVRG